MKGIILAGGTGSRLWPSTLTISKQLLPVYDKPLIYYPLSTLMLAGIKEILIITTQEDQKSFQKLLGDGSNLGISVTYGVQLKPDGLAQALIIGEEFINNDSVMMILGDNIFHGAGLSNILQKGMDTSGAHIYTYEVVNSEQYGILEIDINGKPISIQEKPKKPKSNLAVTGLYIFDYKASQIARTVKRSERGELEITSVIENYLKKNQLGVTFLSRGIAWLDTGNPNALHDAASYVRVIEERTGLKIGCPEEIAYKNGWIDQVKLTTIVNSMGLSSYGKYIKSIT
jgi:glucose-1-phosphate thymidylyltransferase